MIAVLVICSQIQLAWFLRKRWSPGLSRLRTGLIWAMLTPLWLIVGIGLAIDVLQLQYSARLPEGLATLCIAVASLWGFTSILSLNAWGLLSWLRRRTEPHSPGRRQVLTAVTGAAVAAPFVAAGFGAMARTDYIVREIELPIPNLHPDLEGFRIAQISDLHVSAFLSVSEAARVVDMTNELRPELTLITGDLITQVGDPLDATIRELGRLRATEGILGCLGNHEIYANCQKYTTREAAKLGIRFLRQEAVAVRRGQGILNVAGVDFQRNRDKANYIPGSERLILPGASNLLMSHNPDVFPTAVRKGYDAMVAGHTHGGQVTVEIVNQTANLARFFTRYVAGLYRIDGRSGYVNAGIGTIGMPVRLGAEPEITLFRLRRA